jgi:predicted AAA+ superfamily ATPase
MSVKDLKKKLNNILTKDEPVVVSINGKWGVGKTYFWHQFKEQLTDKKVAYIFNGMLINFHHSLSFDKGTHSLFCNWVKNTSKLGKSNCAALCFCPHIGSGK